MNDDEDGGVVFSLYSLSSHEVVQRAMVANRAMELMNSLL
jgi:hypothetical protein